MKDYARSSWKPEPLRAEQLTRAARQLEVVAYDITGGLGPCFVFAISDELVPSNPRDSLLPWYTSSAPCFRLSSLALSGTSLF